MIDKENTPTPEMIKRIIHKYLFEFKLLPTEEQNKQCSWDWIAKHWEPKPNYDYTRK